MLENSIEVPRDAAAEMAILGAMLMGSEEADRACAQLKAECFYGEQNRVVFSAIAGLRDRGLTPDTITLCDDLGRRGILTVVGGAAYVASLQDQVATGMRLDAHCQIVRRHWLRRLLIDLGGRIRSGAEAGCEDPRQLIAEASDRLFELPATAATEKGFEPIAASMNRILNRIDQAQAGTGHSAFGDLMSGFPSLDRLLGGFLKGELILIAARPACGKTSLALSIAHNIAAYQGRPVGICSLETATDDLTLRMLSSACEIPFTRLRSVDLTANEIEAVVQATVGSAPIATDDSTSMTPGELYARARLAKRQQGIEVLIIDYLQLLAGGQRRQQSRQEEVSDISRGLKSIARELKIPVVALSQLSRACESRMGGMRRPRLSDLRDSGSLEQDADKVIFLYRESMYRKHQEPPEADETEVIVAKNRNGPTGTVKLTFVGRYTRFEE